MLDHLRTIAWVQLRLFRNSAKRELRWLGALAYTVRVIAMIFAIVIFTTLAFSGGVALGAAKANTGWILLLAPNVFVMFLLLFCTVQTLVEFQKSDLVDTGKWLFLPIPLRTLFAVNLLTSHVAPVLLFALGPMAGFSLGLAIFQGPRMVLGVPLTLAALAAVGAWFGYFRERILAMSESRVQTVAGIMVTCMALFGIAMPLGVFTQLGTFAKYVTEQADSESEKDETLEEEAAEHDNELTPVLRMASTFFPPGWYALGLYTLREREYGTALLCMAGFAAIAAAGVAVHYRLVMRRHRHGSVTRNANATARARRMSRLTWFRLPALGYEWSAIAGLTAVTRMRTLTVQSSMFMFAAFAGILLALPVFVNMDDARGAWWTDVIPFAAGAFVVFMGAGLSYNIFGQDGAGFQVLVLMPIDREIYLTVKNAVATVFIALWTIMILAAVQFVFRPSPMAALAALLMALQAQLAVAILGNGLSIVFPFRLKEGKMQQPAQPAAAMLPGFALLIALPFIFAPSTLMIPVIPLINSRWEPHGAAMALFAATLIFAATVSIYIASVPIMSAWLRRRESNILQTLAADRE